MTPKGTICFWRHQSDNCFLGYVTKLPENNILSYSDISWRLVE